jgi:hypothetical protein
MFSPRARYRIATCRYRSVRTSRHRTTSGTKVALVVALGWLVGGAGLMPGIASAHGRCGRDWTVNSACPVSGSHAALTGTIVDSNEADYYVFHARPNTQIRLRVADLQSRRCVADFTCSYVTADLYDRAGDVDYLEATTANPANNLLTSSAAPLVLRSAGNYYLRVTAETAGLRYRVRISTSPAVATPPASNLAEPSRARVRPAAHSRGDSWLGGLIVLAFLGLVVRWARRAFRRRRQGSADDELAYANWQAIQARLPQLWPGDLGERLTHSARVLRHDRRVPSGTMGHVRFADSKHAQDTFWRKQIGAPAPGAWVIIAAHKTDESFQSLSGEPVLWVDEIVQTFPADTKSRARRHEKWLRRQARGRSGSGDNAPPPPGEDHGRASSGHRGERDAGDRGPNADSGGPIGGRPDWAFAKLGLSVGAKLKEVSARRRDLAARYHPDLAATATPEIRRLTEEELKRINAAYEAIASWLGGQAPAA